MSVFRAKRRILFKKHGSPGDQEKQFACHRHVLKKPSQPIEIKYKLNDCQKLKKIQRPISALILTVAGFLTVKDDLRNFDLVKKLKQPIGM